ncbi:hypothetical protein M0R45_036123 [Rubus argutus]|uniref:Uncharacterized protein n=1 Tax=Rubus argutus TaxID=59490 RepID=A0AAW1VYT2_RUBAR
MSSAQPASSSSTASETVTNPSHLPTHGDAVIHHVSLLSLKLMLDSSASVILADKGESIKASYLHHLSKLNGGAVVGEIARNFHPKTLHKNPKFGLTLSLTP